MEMSSPEAPKVEIGNSMISSRMIVVIVVVVVLAIVFFMYTLYKRTKKLEHQSKETQKQNNEITNMKYALQETIGAVDGIRRRMVQPVKPKVPMPVPKPVVPKKLKVEEVNEDEIEGVSEIIEVEEDSDSESEEFEE